MPIFENKYTASPFTCFFLSLIFVGIGTWSYFFHIQITEELRLREPVSILAKFQGASCGWSSGKSGGYRMDVVYDYVVSQVIGKAENFKITEPIRFSSLKACQENIPNAQTAYANRYIWYEKSNPSKSRLSLEEKSAFPVLIFMLSMSTILIAFGFAGIERKPSHKTKRR